MHDVEKQHGGDTTALVKSLAAELGFALCGICEADETDHRRHVLDWLARGRHGTMRWLAENVELRMDPRELLPGARSVICVADHIGPETKSKIGPASHVARYAQVDDYHNVIRKRLHKLVDALREQHPTEQFRVCVDTAPILEREHAARAGLGWVGKNTMVIHPERGSHLLLGEVVTTLDLQADEPEPDHCGTCTRCIEACPTQCITPYALNASRCISYLTIEHRETIAADLGEKLGDWLYGCDVCQDVCPYNNPQRGPVGQQPGGFYGPPRPAQVDAISVLGWSEQDRRDAFTRSAMKRAKLNQMKRNALWVLARRVNTDAALRDRVRHIADDTTEDPLVRNTARQVLEQTPSTDCR